MRKRIEGKPKLRNPELLTIETVNPEDYAFIPIVSPRYKYFRMKQLLSSGAIKYMSIKVKDILRKEK